MLQYSWAMFDPSKIRAITLDLDDTLWPIWPTIRRAEEVLLLWLKEHAAQTAQLFSTPEALRAIRNQVEQERPDLRHDLSGLRQASIRQALRQAGDDENLAMPAFEIFFAARQRVELFGDAVPALERLAARWPVVAVTNGNSDIEQIGLGQFFQDSFNVTRTGFAKPDVRIFHCAAQSLELPLSAILHVGDDAKLDAVAARDAGMHAVWLNRSGLDWPIEEQHPPTTVSSLLDLCDLLAA
ncbi:HAD-IA family hydrolase [Comamonas sp.]|uniref:HAD family hydrolase n=1 Tax=unclassified Comamonas TaxID=2638500 RepID=UPI00338F2B53